MKWKPTPNSKNLVSRFITAVTSDDPWMLQWGRLLLWLILLSCMWVIKHAHKATTEQDGVIALSIAFMSGLATLIMLFNTKERSWRNLGLMSIFLGYTLLFGQTGLFYLGYARRAQEPELDVTRTLLIVGGAAFLSGTLKIISDWKWNLKHVALIFLTIAFISGLIGLAILAG